MHIDFQKVTVFNEESFVKICFHQRNTISNVKNRKYFKLHADLVSDKYFKNLLDPTPVCTPATMGTPPQEASTDQRSSQPSPNVHANNHKDSAPGSQNTRGKVASLGQACTGCGQLDSHVGSQCKPQEPDRHILEKPQMSGEAHPAPNTSWGT